MSQWDGKTRGGVTGHKIFVFFIKYFGVSFAYFFLKIVAVYFLFATSQAYKNIYYYFHSVHHYGKVKAYYYAYCNFCMLGKVLVDKIAILSGSEKKYSFNFDGENHLRALVNNNTGGILVNAHIGNWEIAGQLLERLDTKIHILMFDAEHEQVKKYMSEVLQQKNIGVIIIGNDLSHLEKIKEALQNKEIIAMNGDRYMPGNKTITCSFMEREADFPVSPFYMAGKFKVPVVYVFAMKETKYHYHFYATEPRQVENFNSLKLRDESLKKMVNEYVDEIEKMVKRYPVQWFNYYKFWK
jgi:predicted LPLAT superfamily acyltransferase